MTTNNRILRVIVNGATGRMGYRQHLVRSLLAIRDAGGVVVADGSVVNVSPILVGRNEAKLRAIADRHKIDSWTTNLGEALATAAGGGIYFDAQVTHAREEAVEKAIQGGLAVYTEKPLSTSLQGALRLAQLTSERGVPNGVVADKLYLPGMLKLRGLLDEGFFGRVLSVKGEFGYWVFDGQDGNVQRPSWNYRKEDGGGIVLDMFAHWSYLIRELFGPIKTITTHATTLIPRRWDETGKSYEATADDAAYAIFQLESGPVVQINSSWCARVHRDELLELQVDGTQGSAIVGLWGCRTQSLESTPRPVWDPDMPASGKYRSDWTSVQGRTRYPNAFRAQWEEFIRHTVDGAPFAHDFHSGAQGMQLAELALESSRLQRSIDVPSSIT
jgi:predicted dehydrogenase